MNDNSPLSFNRALWIKAFTEIWLLLVALSVLMFTFAWLFVWLTSMIELPALFDFLASGLPRSFERLSGVPFREVATPAGRIALAYVDPLVLLAVTVWAIARGSDAVSGELERGTMELMLAQPVRRISVYASKAVAAIVGLGIMTLALWLGTAVGIDRIMSERDSVRAGLYTSAAFNVFGLGFALLGLSTMVSSFDKYRWRTIGIMGAFYATSLVMKVIARMAPGWEWIGYASIFTAFEPQLLVAQREQAGAILLQYNGALMALGAVAFVIGGVVFCRRDLPAPL